MNDKLPVVRRDTPSMLTADERLLVTLIENLKRRGDHPLLIDVHNSLNAAFTHLANWWELPENKKLLEDAIARRPTVLHTGTAYRLGHGVMTYVNSQDKSLPRRTELVAGTLIYVEDSEEGVVEFKCVSYNPDIPWNSKCYTDVDSLLESVINKVKAQVLHTGSLYVLKDSIWAEELRQSPADFDKLNKQYPNKAELEQNLTGGYPVQVEAGSRIKVYAALGRYIYFTNINRAGCIMLHRVEFRVMDHVVSPTTSGDPISMQDSFTQVVDPVVRWMRQFANPHSTVLITQVDAEMLQGTLAVPFPPTPPMPAEHGVNFPPMPAERGLEAAAER